MSILSQQKQSQAPDFPNLRPSLDLRFALAKKLDPRITFTRGSTGTYFGPDGLMRTAIANEPRFDHDPITGQSLGLLIEESRTNLFLYSDSPNLAFYDPTMTDFSVNSIISPDGTQNADKVLALSGKSFAQISQGVTITSGATVTGSVYIKYGGFNRVEIVMLSNNNTTPYARATFDPITGTITTAVSTANGGTNASANIVFVGNGWYRCNVTVTYPAVTLAGMRINATSSSAGISEGSLGVYVWGMQIEQGAFPTSYIPTTASTVTRSVDFASMTGTNFSSWYNQSEGSIVSNCITRRPPNTGNGADFAITNSFTTTYTSRIVGWFNIGPAPLFSVFANNNTVYLPFIGVPGVVTNIPVKKAISLADKNMRVATNGTLITGDLGNTGVQDYLPTDFNRLLIGYEGIFAGYLNGTISRLTYYPIQLTNQQLINLTN